MNQQLDLFSDDDEGLPLGDEDEALEALLQEELDEDFDDDIEDEEDEDESIEDEEDY